MAVITLCCVCTVCCPPFRVTVSWLLTGWNFVPPVPFGIADDPKPPVVEDPNRPPELVPKALLVLEPPNKPPVLF